METLASLLQQLGFRPADILLLIAAPVCAGIGSTVHGMLTEMNPMRLPTGGRVRSHVEIAVFVKWCSYRLFVGCALGLVVALYFVGSLNESATSIARVLALAILVGYAAPKLWALQEQHLLQQAKARFSDQASESK